MEVGEQHEVVPQERRAPRAGAPSPCRRARPTTRPRPVGTIFAPGRLVLGVVDRRELTPAPCSTRTSTPCSDSSRTPSGVIATRCSLFLTSPGTPTVRVIASFPRRPDPPCSMLPVPSAHARSCIAATVGRRAAPRIAVQPDGAPGWFAEAVRAGGGDWCRSRTPRRSCGRHPATATAWPGGPRPPGLRWVQLPWAGIEPYRDVIDDAPHCGPAARACTPSRSPSSPSPCCSPGCAGGVRYARADRLDRASSARACSTRG